MPKKRVLFGIGVTMVVSCLSFFLLYTHVLKPPSIIHAEPETTQNDEVDTDDIQAQDQEMYTGLDFNDYIDYDGSDEDEDEGEGEGEDVEPTYENDLAQVTDEIDDVNDTDTIDEVYDIDNLYEIYYVDDLYNIVDIYDVDNLYYTDDIEIYEYDDENTIPREPPSWEPTATPNLVRVHIPYGTPASRISRTLYNAGVVESHQSFLGFLIDNDYTRIMDSGTFRLVVGATYEELARQLVRRRR